MKLLRKLFGVSLKTHQHEVRQCEAIIDALKRQSSSETKGKLRAQEKLREERAAHAKCQAAAKELELSRESMVDINRDLAKELYRLRELFQVVFTSKKAKELALENRTVHLAHLRKISPGNKFTAKHVAHAITIATRDEPPDSGSESD